jgi:hypothetical protein
LSHSTRPFLQWVFQDRISQSIYLGWLWTVILLISDYWVARTTKQLSSHSLAYPLTFFEKKSICILENFQMTSKNSNYKSNFQHILWCIWALNIFLIKILEPFNLDHSIHRQYLPYNLTNPVLIVNQSSKPDWLSIKKRLAWTSSSW